MLYFVLFHFPQIRKSFAHILCHTSLVGGAVDDTTRSLVAVSPLADVVAIVIYPGCTPRLPRGTLLLGAAGVDASQVIVVNTGITPRSKLPVHNVLFGQYDGPVVFWL